MTAPLALALVFNGVLVATCLYAAARGGRPEQIAAPEFGPRKLYANLGRAAGQDDDDAFAVIWNPAD